MSVMTSQSCLVESQHRIATSRESIAVALYRCTRRASIHGGSGEGADARARCSQVGAIEVGAQGDFGEAGEKREAFSRDAEGLYVSPVVRLAGGRWGWRICPACLNLPNGSNGTGVA